MSRKIKTTSGTFVDIKDRKAVVNGAFVNIQRRIVKTASGFETVWERQSQTYGLVFTGNQYINSLINGSSELRVVADVSMNTVPGTTSKTIFGTRTGAAEGSFSFWQVTNSAPYNSRTDFNASNGTVLRTTAPFEQRLVIDKNKNVTSIDGVIVFTSPYSSFAGSLPLFIGTMDNNGAVYASGFEGIMYSCQIYENDILVRDFVPVPQGSTAYSSTAAPSHCMWDLVGEQYYVNANSGSFDIVEAL